MEIRVSLSRSMKYRGDGILTGYHQSILGGDRLVHTSRHIDDDHGFFCLIPTTLRWVITRGDLGMDLDGHENLCPPCREKAE